MRIKHLEASLSCLQREFDEPKIDLEQYPTCPELAASIMDMAVKRGDIGNPGQSCLDLGCGTGMLTVAAAFVVEEGEFVWGVDCDEDALTIARNNVDHVELEDCVKFIHAKVRMKEANLDGTDDNNKNVGGPHKKRGGRNSRDAGRGRVGRGGRGGAHNAASSTKSRLIHDKEDGVPLADNCVE
jgi:SAM-dependent methyltransferase